MKQPPDTEFYIGWRPAAPPGVARATRRAVLAIAVLALGALALLLAAPRRLADGRFEFGRTRSFEGLLMERPLPLLWVPGEGSDDGRLLVLVARAKFGADDLVRGWDGRRARVAGSLVERDGVRALELQGPPHGVDTAAAGAPDAARGAPPALALGMVRVAGEIVDSKCYLGVMNPGEGKVHRECAIRCLSGGVPPALAVRTTAGPRALALLHAPDGEPLGPRLLDRLAEPVEVRGRLERRGDLLLLEVEPAAVSRIGAG